MRAHETSRTPAFLWMAASAALAQELRGLEDLFSQGRLEDRNGDGLTDFVNARLVGNVFSREVTRTGI